MSVLPDFMVDAAGMAPAAPPAPPPATLAAAIHQAFLPGVFYGMPAEQYHAVEAMSASGAKKMLRSPQHYKLMRDTPSEPTAAMQFGTAVHSGVLEPDTFAEAVAIAPEVNKRTNAGKAEWEAFASANAGRLVLSVADHARVLRCIDAVRAHPAAMALLEGAQREVSLFWEDGQFKVPCKSRFDAWNHNLVIDLKTTQDASPDTFPRQAASLLYHAQAAFYFSAAEHLFDRTPDGFVFICVESEPPHAVACYTMPGNAILAGSVLVNVALERYAAALAEGKWPGYPPTVETMKFPAWALKFDL